MCCEHCAPETMRAIREGKTLHLKAPLPPPRSRDCTCSRVWGAITAPPPCPIHGAAPVMKIVC